MPVWTNKEETSGLPTPEATRPRSPVVSIAVTRTLVVGAGLGGLVAARELAKLGHQVAILEASDRIGGQINTATWHGLPVDTGAEAMFLGGPHLKPLLTELDLLDGLVAPQPGSSWLRTDKGKLVPLPEGVGPTGPTKLDPVIRSGLLSAAALARAGLEPMRTKPVPGDISVGDFVAGRFGKAVVDTFVDPLLGNLHAGDVYRLSLLSTAPQLVPAAREGRSLIRNTPPPPPADGPRVPPFASFAGGLSTLIHGLAKDLTIHTGVTVSEAGRTPEGWTVGTTQGPVTTDNLVLAVPAAVAATLLDPTSPGIGEELTAGRTADVATIVLAYPKSAADNPALRDGNGLLLRSGTGRQLKAATFLSRKWAHLADGDAFLVRASAGRAGVDSLSLMDDRTLVRRIHQELADITGLDARPQDSLVARWPGSYPQLEVGHQARMSRIRETLAPHPVALVGAPYDGLGMPSVVRSALAGASLLGGAAG